MREKSPKQMRKCWQQSGTKKFSAEVLVVLAYLASSLFCCRATPWPSRVVEKARRGLKTMDFNSWFYYSISFFLFKVVFSGREAWPPKDQSQLELVVVGRGWTGGLGWGQGDPALLVVLGGEDELHFTEPGVWWEGNEAGAASWGYGTHLSPQLHCLLMFLHW
jgi:hypothetical protein